MKKVSSVVLLTVLVFQFHLAPGLVNATGIEEIEAQEIEEVESNFEEVITEEVEETESVDDTEEEEEEVEVEEEEEEEVEVVEEDEEEISTVDPSVTEEKVDEVIEEEVEQEEAVIQSTPAVMSVDLQRNVILRNGVRHSSVRTLKRNLGKLGFAVPGKGTTYYGNSTEQKVKEFQRYYKLQVDGISGPGTLAKIDSILSSPLQKGKKHKNTKTLKVNLKTLGFPVPGKGTTLYGVSTEQKVKDFQKHYGLTVNGIADEITLSKINDEVKKIPTGELKNGVRHNDVKVLKSNLKKIGFPVPGKGTTLYGPSTEKVVKEFQAYYNLTADGIAGKGTLAKVDSILSSPLQKGKKHKNTKTLKANLKTLGFTVPGKGTTLYGAATEKQVKAFQKRHGLKVNGIADEVTLKKITALLPKGLQNGVKHKDVKKLKSDLGKLGFKVPGKGTTLYGPSTEAKVKEFQAHYALGVSGVADEKTLSKVKELLASPLQYGKRHRDVIKLKNNLTKVDFVVPGNNTNYFGKSTEKQVKAFQKKMRLPISGIADKGTLAVLANEIDRLQAPTYKQYNVTLKQSLDVQMKQLQQTDKYRNAKAYIHSDYVNFIGLISSNNSNLRSKASTKSTSTFTKIKANTKVTIVKEVKGEKFRNSTVWYELIYKNKKVYAHSSIINPSTTLAKTTAKVNVRAEANTKSHIYETLAKGTEITILKKNKTWHEVRSKTWRNPTRQDVEQYLNPKNNDRFQHLVLSSSVRVSAGQLNKVLAGKGVLNDMGQAFIDGGKKASVNEVYLISHAFLETGQGTSNLAKGIEVGLNSKGKPEVVTSTNRSKLKSIKKTYNMFGIGANDVDPGRLGAIRAYNEKWFTPEAAVIGGAKFIGERYVHNIYQQDTLYKMRWNPANPGYPQYATDIAWATKQVSQIKAMYQKLDDPLVQFNIPLYK